VPRDAFSRIWTHRPVLLLPVGDSVTAGFGARPGYGYVDRLMANPPDEFTDLRDISLSAVLPSLQVKKLARSGSNSLEHVEMLAEFEPQEEEVLGLVVMTSGGNDLIHWYGRSPPREGAMYGATLAQARPWIANFEKRLDGMLDRLNECFSGGCHIFLADIYDPTDGLGDARMAGLPAWKDGLAIVSAYNEIIRRACDARANVYLVPMREAFLGHGIHCRQWWRDFYRSEDPHYWYGSNLEDPNERGYDALRRLFLIEMARVADEFDSNTTRVRDLTSGSE
jgi:hypothetical protein